MYVYMSNLNVHAACPFCLSIPPILHVHAAWFSLMSLLHVPAACPRCMPMLYVHGDVLASCMFILHVHCACPYCMSMLQVISACPCCMSKVHVNAALFQKNLPKFRRNKTLLPFRFGEISFQGNPTIRLSYFVSFRLVILAKFRRNKYFVIPFQQNFAEISAK